MVDVLTLHRRFPAEVLDQAVAGALAAVDDVWELVRRPLVALDCRWLGDVPAPAATSPRLRPVCCGFVDRRSTGELDVARLRSFERARRLELLHQEP